MVSLVAVSVAGAPPADALFPKPSFHQYRSGSRVKLALVRVPTYGYRRLGDVLGENRKPIQCTLQLKGW